MAHRLLLLLGLMLLSLPVFAQVAPVPPLMNFQGRLTRADGTPVSNGNYSITFSLWNDAASTNAINKKWEQTLSTLAVRNGTFAALLSGFPADIFKEDLWLEIKIGSDPALTPRQRLVTAAYAFKADSVKDGAISSQALADGSVITAKLSDGSVTPSKLASSTLNNLFWLLSGNNGTNPSSHFIGTTDNQSLAFRTSNVERMRILANGNIGINTATPTNRLSVNGSANFIGSVGIGTASPLRLLHVQSNGYGLMIGNGTTGATNIQFGNFGGTPAIQGVQTEGTTYGVLRINPEGGLVTVGAQTFNNVVFNVANTARYAIGTDGIIIAGDYVNNSDARLKTDVHRVEDALGSILALDGVTYHWNESARSAYNLPATRRIGFLAQDVERVLPDLVMTGPRGTKAVSYIGIVPVLVEAVKTLNGKVEKRDAEVAELKAQVAALTEAVKKLQAERQK